MGRRVGRVSPYSDANQDQSSGEQTDLTHPNSPFPTRLHMRCRKKDFTAGGTCCRKRVLVHFCAPLSLTMRGIRPPFGGLQAVSRRERGQRSKAFLADFKICQTLTHSMQCLQVHIPAWFFHMPTWKSLEKRGSRRKILASH